MAGIEVTAVPRPTVPFPDDLVRDPARGTWFGSQGLKDWAVARMAWHREMDLVVQGTYQEVGFGREVKQEAQLYKGCLVGCTLPPVIRAAPNTGGRRFMTFPDGTKVRFLGWHGAIEDGYGIQAVLASLLDREFESTYFDDAPGFAVDALEAIPLGVVYTVEAIDSWYNRENGSSEDFLEFLRTRGVPA